MQIKLFTVPVGDSGSALAELNRFLRANKILDIREEIVGRDGGACWCFCVRYLEQAAASSELRPKVDYKEVLDEKTFGRFSKLREIRRKAAVEEGLPAFAVFTDGELAELAKLDVLTMSAIKSIKGIGEKKAERFGRYFIESAPQHETNG